MLFHYLKYFLFHVVGLAALASLVAGGSWTTAGLLAVLAVYFVGDAIWATTPRRPTSSTPAS